jgi:hypothetical protein
MAKKALGRKVWFFPDGDLPPPGRGRLRGHESLVILNPNDRDAEITATIYYTDREPERAGVEIVKARRVRCIRTDEGIGGVRVPFGQYALKIESSTPVICQIGRMDVRQANLAYYTVMGFPG